MPVDESGSWDAAASPTATQPSPPTRPRQEETAENVRGLPQNATPSSRARVSGISPRRGELVRHDKHPIALKHDRLAPKEVDAPVGLGDDKRPISSEGGREPVWGRDGRQLFFRQRSDSAVMVVAVETEPAVRFRPPELLFKGPYYSAGGVQYDVARDGRFLMVGTSAVENTDLVVALDWSEELKGRFPAN